MSDTSAWKYAYDQMLVSYTEACRAKINAEMKLKEIQEKYNKVYGVEVVRSKIEDREMYWCDLNFKEDRSSFAGMDSIAISYEVRMQKWFYMLTTCTDDRVIFLRKLILLHHLDPKYYKTFKGASYKSVLKLSGYFKFVELNKLRIEHLQKNYQKQDSFICALLDYLIDDHDLDRKPPTHDTFTPWYLRQFSEFAKNVAEIHSVICHKIHRARFAKDDIDIPKEYDILEKPELKLVINFIMSFY
ncbi:uncharacterized protein LOC135833376 [Planococcus citri]|uniref:uncharacterized protein LOC135833376 n=1 Tax=Planococcus citri TaxID=170843 RepID=UPI0031F88A40